MAIRIFLPREGNDDLERLLTRILFVDSFVHLQNLYFSIFPPHHQVVSKEAHNRSLKATIQSEINTTKSNHYSNYKRERLKTIIKSSRQQCSKETQTVNRKNIHVFIIPAIRVLLQNYLLHTYCSRGGVH